MTLINSIDCSLLLTGRLITNFRYFQGLNSFLSKNSTFSIRLLGTIFRYLKGTETNFIFGTMRPAKLGSLQLLPTLNFVTQSICNAHGYYLFFFCLYDWFLRDDFIFSFLMILFNLCFFFPTQDDLKKAAKLEYQEYLRKQVQYLCCRG